VPQFNELPRPVRGGMAGRVTKLWSGNIYAFGSVVPKP